LATLIFLIIDGTALLGRDLSELFNKNDDILYNSLSTFDSYLIFAQMSLFLAGMSGIIIRNDTNSRLGYLLLSLSAGLILYSTSRGAMIAFSVFLLANYDLFSARARRALLVVLGIFVFSSSFLIDVLWTGFSDLGTTADFSSSRRLDAISIGLDGFSNSLLFGQGWDFVRNTASIPPHSMPIQLLAELGLVGAILELFIHINVYRFLKVNTNLKGLAGLYLTFVFWSMYENIGWIYGHRILVIILMIGIIFYRANAHTNHIRLPEHKA
jgi:hypothetical protein